MSTHESQSKAVANLQYYLDKVKKRIVNCKFKLNCDKISLYYLCVYITSYVFMYNGGAIST